MARTTHESRTADRRLVIETGQQRSGVERRVDSLVVRSALEDERPVQLPGLGNLQNVSRDEALRPGNDGALEFG